MKILGVHFFSKTTARLICGTASDLAGQDIELNRHNSESLPECLYGFLGKNGFAAGDIERIGVVIGPGALTSLRLSVAVAQTIGALWSIPTVGIGTFELLAQDNMRFQCPIIKGRRDRIVGQLFVAGSQGSPHCISDVFEMSEAQWVSKLKSFRVAPVMVSTDAALIAMLSRSGFDSRWVSNASMDQRFIQLTVQRLIGREPLRISYAYSAA